MYPTLRLNLSTYTRILHNIGIKYLVIFTKYYIVGRLIVRIT